MTRDWEPWNIPEYAESRLEDWGHPLDPPKTWKHGKYDRLCVLPKMILGYSVLDVGCGLGHTYVLVNDAVEEYLGLDLSTMIKICHRYFPENSFKEGDIFDLSPWGTYDTVMCTQLLVHLPTLIEPLKQLWRHAEKCILITVSVPSKAETFRQNEVGLIGHRWTKEQLASAIETLEGVQKVEAWRGTRIIYIRVSRAKHGGITKVDPRILDPENMPLARP